MTTLGDHDTTPRVLATAAALEAIGRIRERRGPVMFYQSGGCCDGSLPMCFDDGELIVGDADVLLGHIGGCPFFIDGRQYEVWKGTQLIVDIGDGEPEGFSREAGPDKHFITRSRLFGVDQVVTEAPARSHGALRNGDSQ